MKIEDLIKSVKEENLTKDQLENYSILLSNFFAEMQIEMADLEKDEAIFLEQTDTTVARAKVIWKATEKGQRLIVLKRYERATSKLLDSVKRRLYSIY